MKLALLLLPLLLHCGAGEGRSYNQHECKVLATVAGQAAGYRETKVAMPQVLADFKEAAANDRKSTNPTIRFAGDYEFVQRLIVVAYNSGWSSTQTYAIVFTVCDRNGRSVTVREI